MSLSEEKALVQQRNYSSEEIQAIYSLAFFQLDIGQHRIADTVLEGLTEVAPDFHPAWLAKAFVKMLLDDFESGRTCCEKVLKIEPNCPEALVYLILCCFQSGDRQSAGTYLGELGERISAGLIESPNISELYKALMLRYQSENALPQ